MVDLIVIFNEWRHCAKSRQVSAKQFSSLFFAIHAHAIVSSFLYILKIIFLFVLSGRLQVFNEHITVFAPHFSSRTIHGLQGLSKGAMSEQAILKAHNEVCHGPLGPPRRRQSPVTHCSNIITIVCLHATKIVHRGQMATFCSFLPALERLFLVLFEAHLAVVVKVSELA